MSDGDVSRSASEAAFQDADMQASQRGTDETVRIALQCLLSWRRPMVWILVACCCFLYWSRLR